MTEGSLSQIAPLLLELGTGGLAWWRIRHTELAKTPAASSLREAYRLNTLFTTLHEGQIAEVFELLRRSGVEPLLAKGWAVGRLYPERGLRPYGDIDLAVPPSQFLAASHALLVDSPAVYPVDLHPGFGKLIDRTTEELFRRSQSIKLQGVGVRILGPEDHLRLLCIHLFRHGARWPLSLCDIGLFLESLPPDFDWDYCLSGDRRFTGWLVCAFHLAHQLLGAELSSVPTSVQITKIPGWMGSAILHQWSSGYARLSPMSSHLRNRNKIWKAIRQRWPNPIEAVVRWRQPFGETPSFPLQLSAFLLRAGLFVLRPIIHPRQTSL